VTSLGAEQHIRNQILLTLGLGLVLEYVCILLTLGSGLACCLLCGYTTALEL